MLNATFDTNIFVLLGSLAIYYLRTHRLISHLLSTYTPKQYLLLPEFKESWKFSKTSVILLSIEHNANRFDGVRFVSYEQTARPNILNRHSAGMLNIVSTG